MESYLLGWDIGTSNIKAVLLSEGGLLRGNAAVPQEIRSPEPGYAELDPEEIWTKLLRVTDLLLEQTGVLSRTISAVGVSSLCPGLILLDRNMEPLHPAVIVLDRRSCTEAEELNRLPAGDAIREAGKNRIAAGANSLPWLLWFRRNRPEIWERMAVFGFLTSWLGYRLTGKFGLDYSGASFTGLFETGGQRIWRKDLALETGIDPAVLPDLMPSGAELGRLKNRDLLGRGFSQGTIVAAGGADTACSALTLGVFDRGDRFLSLGTSGVLCGATDAPVFDDRCMNRCHVAGSGWLMNGAMSNTGLSVRWLQSILKGENNPGEDAENHRLKDLTAPGFSDRLLEGTSPGAGGLVFLPYLTGERTPVWDMTARGAFFGLHAGTTGGDLLRAVLESAGFGLRQILEIIEPLTGVSEQLTVIGGGSVNHLWLQILAEITGKRMVQRECPEAAAAGAALLAGLAAGVYRNEREASRVIGKKTVREAVPEDPGNPVYEKNFAVYRELYPALRPLFHSFSRTHRV